MFEIESIILFTGILSFLLIAGLHLMRELDIFLKKDKKEREVSFVFNAINFILSFLLTSDGSRRKKRWLPPESRFLSSNVGFLSPVPLPAGEALGVPR